MGSNLARPLARARGGQTPKHDDPEAAAATLLAARGPRTCWPADDPYRLHGPGSRHVAMGHIHTAPAGRQRPLASVRKLQTGRPQRLSRRGVQRRLQPSCRVSQARGV